MHYIILINSLPGNFKIHITPAKGNNKYISFRKCKNFPTRYEQWKPLQVDLQISSEESEIDRCYLLFQTCDWGHCHHPQGDQLGVQNGYYKPSCGIRADMDLLLHSPALFGLDVHFILTGDTQISLSRVLR